MASPTLDEGFFDLRGRSLFETKTITDRKRWNLKMSLSRFRLPEAHVGIGHLDAPLRLHTQCRW